MGEKMRREMPLGMAAVGFLALVPAVVLLAGGRSATTSPTVVWPTKGWPKGTPASVGVDEQALASLDADLESGKFMLVDSFQVFRCGTEVFTRKYAHDYGQIYGKEAKT